VKTPWSPSAPTRYRFLFHSFTTSVVPNILNAVHSKKEKLPLSVTHPELAKEASGWDPYVLVEDDNPFELLLSHSTPDSYR
jgi:hypothetical protein